MRIGTATPTLISVCVLSLCACSQSGSRRAATATSTTASTQAGVISGSVGIRSGVAAAELSVLKASPLADGALFTFSALLDPSSVNAGSVLAYRDTDLDPSGVFEALPVDTWLTGEVLRVRASVPLDGRQVRITLSDALRSRAGAPLERGGAAVSFDDRGVYELRFQPRPPAPQPVAGTPAVAANVADDHGDHAGAASLLGTSAPGEIGVAGDRDWFVVNLRPNLDYVLRTETSGDTVLTLYAPDGATTVAVNDDAATGGRHSRIEFSPTTSGDHYLVVEGYGQSTPSYTLHAESSGSAPREPGSDPASARALALGERVSEVIGRGDQDWYSLSLSAGVELAVEVDHADVTLILLDERGRGFTDPVHQVRSGETLGTIARRYGIDYLALAELNGVSDPNRISVGQRLHVPATSSLRAPIRASKTYHLRLEGFLGATPSYRVSARDARPTPQPNQSSDDHGNTRSHATDLPLGSARSGSIEIAGDVDLFALGLSEGRRYELTVTPRGSGDTTLALLDAVGNAVAENDDDPRGGRGSRLVFAPATSGRYALRVGGFGTTTPQYDVRVEEQSVGQVPDPSDFRQRAGTDVWHIDFELRSDLFAQDMAAHGLSSGQASIDRLARDRVIASLLGHLSQKYGLSERGEAVAGVSWRVSFVSDAPAGRPGRNYSREVVGGTHEDGGGTLGVSYLDPGNRRREDNDDLGELGIFSASINGRDSTLRPALSGADRAYLDGSYRLGDGTSTQDRRFTRILDVIDDWAHALAVVTAHEVGHSVGLNHDESDRRGIMQAALSRWVLSDDATHFATPSADVLTTNLRRD